MNTVLTFHGTDVYMWHQPLNTHFYINDIKVPKLKWPFSAPFWGYNMIIAIENLKSYGKVIPWF